MAHTFKVGDKARVNTKKHWIVVRRKVFEAVSQYESKVFAARTPL